MARNSTTGNMLIVLIVAALIYATYQVIGAQLFANLLKASQNAPKGIGPLADPKAYALALARSSTNQPQTVQQRDTSETGPAAADPATGQSSADGSTDNTGSWVGSGSGLWGAPTGSAKSGPLGMSPGSVFIQPNPYDGQLDDTFVFEG